MIIETKKFIDVICSELSKEDKDVIYAYMTKVDEVRGNDLCYHIHYDRDLFDMEEFEEDQQKALTDFWSFLDRIGIKEGEDFILSYWW